MKIEALLSATSELLAEIDRRTQAFAMQSGLQCPAGCGECCEKPEVEATILEMLPAARSILQSGSVEAFFQNARRDGICMLYQNSGQPGKGRCTRYGERGLICRMFGFAGRIRGNGRAELAACRIHRADQADRVAASERMAFPLFSDAAIALAGLDPDLGTRRYPINEALLRAIDYLGLRMQYQETPEPESIPEDPAVPHGAPQGHTLPSPS